MPYGKSGTLREHLESVQRQTGRIPKRLKQPEFPKEFLYVWDWYSELDGTRGFTESGSCPITFQEIDAWARLFCIDIGPFEVFLIKQLDMVHLQTVSEHLKRRLDG